MAKTADANDVNVSEVKEFMLSTSDNPFNPFTQFREWFAFDVANGYNTCSYLARICELSDEVCDRETRLSINDAIEEALMFNLTGNRIKVEKPAELEED
jgi:hypothetical protein